MELIAVNIPLAVNASQLRLWKGVEVTIFIPELHVAGYGRLFSATDHAWIVALSRARKRTCEIIGRTDKSICVRYGASRICYIGRCVGQ
jgi:hypothetical protein